jgi:hypothetical protein
MRTRFGTVLAYLYPVIGQSSSNGSSGTAFKTRIFGYTVGHVKECLDMTEIPQTHFCFKGLKTPGDRVGAFGSHIDFPKTE